MKRTRFLAALLFVSALSVMSCSSGDDGPSGPSSEQTPAALLGSTGGGGILRDHLNGHGHNQHKP